MLATFDNPLGSGVSGPIDIERRGNSIKLKVNSTKKRAKPRRASAGCTLAQRPRRPPRDGGELVERGGMDRGRRGARPESGDRRGKPTRGLSANSRDGGGQALPPCALHMRDDDDV